MSNPDESNQTIHQLQKVFWVGIGCKRGTSWQLFDKAIEEVFAENNLFSRAIAGIATIDTKASEVGLLEFCHIRKLPLKTFCAEVLHSVCVPNPSAITNHEVGTPSVAEAAAILAVTQLNPSFFSSTEKLRVKLLIPKQIFQLKGQPGTVTLAVAQASNLNIKNFYSRKIPESVARIKNGF